jgi:hypothetical protein
LSSPHEAPPPDGEVDSAPRRGIGPQGILGVASFAAILVLGLLFALRFLFGESLPELTEDVLDAAMTRWQENGPASYDLDLKIAGRQPGVVHVEVRNGEVTVANRDGRPTPERTWDEWSVPGQFDTLIRELEMAADPQGEMNAPRGARIWLRAEFDPKFGYPRKFHRYASGGAIEMSWRTTAFTPK